MFNEADRRLAILAATQHGIFTLGDARRMGLTHGQLDRRVACYWTAVHEGVFRVPGSVPSWQGDLYAACAAATPPAAVSHVAAAGLYGLPGGAERVEITCRRWKRTRKPHIVVHESTRFTHEDISEVDGIPVVTPERLVLELAGLRPVPGYVELVIQAARRKRLITYESTRATFDRLARRGLPGVKAMRVALARWDPSSRPTHSEMETLLVQALRRHGLPDPVTQFEVRDEFGNVVAQADAAYPQWRVTIEYDSRQEHSDEFQLARDARRRNEVIAAGYLVLSARHDDLRTGGAALADQILRAARRHAS